jgi:hypothetical protein
VSGTNIKTINGNSVLGSGDLVISGGSGDYFPLSGGTLTGNTSATGSDSYGVILQTTSPTSSTANAEGFRTNFVGANSGSPYTTTNIVHYRAQTYTLGTNQAITNQMGFFAGSPLTNATNNYGFYGAINNAAGRWNFYAAGTAPNYFAGDMFLPSSYSATTSNNPNLFIDTDGRLLRSTAVIGGGGGYTPTILKVTTTQSTISTTMINVTELSTFSLDANSVYEFECYVIFQTVTTTTGIKLGYITPVNTITTTSIVVPITNSVSSTYFSATMPQGALTNSIEMTTTGYNSINSNFTGIIRGLIFTPPNNPNGLLQIRFASEVNNSSVSVRPGSVLKIIKIG